MTIDTEKLRALSRSCEYVVKATEAGDVSELWAVRFDVMGRPYDSRIGVTSHSVAALIAAAVNALPELLDALATAEARVAKLEGVVECAKASVEINQALGDKAAENMQKLATAEATIKAANDVLTFEFCLPWRKEPLPERVRRAQRNAIDEWQAEEGEHKATKAKLATAEAERLTLARAYATGETLTEAEQFDAADLAARIVAEADAAKVAT